MTKGQGVERVEGFVGEETEEVVSTCTRGIHRMPSTWCTSVPMSHHHDTCTIARTSVEAVTVAMMVERAGVATVELGVAVGAGMAARAGVAIAGVAKAAEVGVGRVQQCRS